MEFGILSAMVLLVVEFGFILFLVFGFELLILLLLLLFAMSSALSNVFLSVEKYVLVFIILFSLVSLFIIVIASVFLYEYFDIQLQLRDI